MTTLKAGDEFPSGVVFSYVHITPEAEAVTSCGMPGPFKASEELKDKKVIIVAMPGAFTPTCQASHVPSYISRVDELKAKGIDKVIVLAYNDAFVMSAWAKANGLKDSDYFIFASDDGTKFSQSIGWTMGERTGRYAVVVDHGKVIYAEKEDGKGIEKSGAEAVLAAI